MRKWNFDSFWLLIGHSGLKTNQKVSFDTRAILSIFRKNSNVLQIVNKNRPNKFNFWRENSTETYWGILIHCV